MGTPRDNNEMQLPSGEGSAPSARIFVKRRLHLISVLYEQGRSSMTHFILAVALVADIAADAAVTAAPQINPRPIGRAVERLMPGGTIVSTQGDAVASARLTLERASPPALAAQAEFMSVGPMGPWESDTLSSGALSFVEASFRRLRVTLGSCERSAWLWIDDIVTGPADSRTHCVPADRRGPPVSASVRQRMTVGLPPGVPCEIDRPIDLTSPRRRAETTTFDGSEVGCRVPPRPRKTKETS